MDEDNKLYRKLRCGTFLLCHVIGVIKRGIKTVFRINPERSYCMHVLMYNKYLPDTRLSHPPAIPVKTLFDIIPTI